MDEPAAPRKRGTAHLLVCLPRGRSPIFPRSLAMPSTPPPTPQVPGARPSRAPGALLAAGLWAALTAVARLRPPDGTDHGNLGQFIGRLHPLLVHGPIALLILVPLMELAGLRPRWAHLRSAAGWILLAAAAAVFASAFDGWLLAWSGGYRGRDVTLHMWGGVQLAAVCAAAAWTRGASGAARRAYPALLAGALALMVWTAHGGGSITHGDGYLTEKMPARLRAWLGMAAAPAQEAAQTAPGPAFRTGLGSMDPANPAFYVVHVAPLLERSCVRCHKPEKHKAGLRMDSYALLLHGAEDGPVVVPGNPAKSELIRRVKLPARDDDSMPSDGDKPLAPEEIQMIERWISAGAKGG